MKLEEIDSGLISILLSNPSLENIRYLQWSKILNKSEELLCEECISCYGILGKNQIKSILKREGMTDDTIEQIDIFNKKELFLKISDLVINRRNQQNKELIEEALNESTYDTFTQKSIDAINSRYRSNIQIKEDNVLEELESYCNLEIGEYIDEGMPIGIEEVDKITIGIPTGKVTTIVDMNGKYSHLLINHIAYNSIQNSLNVLYISLNQSKRHIYLELLSRHSCDDKFNNSLSMKDLTTKFNERLYATVYDDIKDKFLNYLSIYDANNFNIQNVFVFQRIFTEADIKFRDLTGKSVEIILIDSISKLRIDTSRKTITNHRVIEKEYYMFLNDMANKFLGENVSVPIVVSNISDEEYNELLNSGVYYNLSFISDRVKTFSSTIYALKGSNDLDKAHNVELSLLKSLNGNTIDGQLIRAEVEYSKVYNKTNDEQEPANDKVKIDRLEEEVKKLREEKDEKENNNFNDLFSLDDLVL